MEVNRLEFVLELIHFEVWELAHVHDLVLVAAADSPLPGYYHSKN